MTGDLGYSVIEEFRSELPNQFLNMGITEQATMSYAAGLAKSGFKPFVYSIANFPTFRCLEQIRNDVNFMNLNVTIVAVGAGFAYGTAGYSHHLVEDISAMRSLSNLEIYSPHDPLSVSECLQSILGSKSPSYLRLGRGSDISLTNHLKLEELKEPSKTKGMSIFFTGSIGLEVLNACEVLKIQGIEVEPISISNFAKVSSEELSKLIAGKPFITVEEHLLAGGFGSLVLELLTGSDRFLCAGRLGVNRIDSMASGSTNYLRKYYEIDAASIVNKVKTVITKAHE
jgi:transketolase